VLLAMLFVLLHGAPQSATARPLTAQRPSGAPTLSVHLQWSGDFEIPRDTVGERDRYKGDEGLNPHDFVSYWRRVVRWVLNDTLMCDPDEHCPATMRVRLQKESEAFPPIFTLQFTVCTDEYWLEYFIYSSAGHISVWVIGDAGHWERVNTDDVLFSSPAEKQRNAHIRSLQDAAYSLVERDPYRVAR
jgi:hypothetical protein